MFIILWSNEPALRICLQEIGEVLQCSDIKALGVDLETQADLIVVGPPYTEKDVKKSKVKHKNIYITNSEEDLKSWINKTMGLFNAEEVFKSSLEEPQKPSTPKEYRKILLVTTKMSTIKLFAPYQPIIKTSVYSARKALALNPDVIVWDLETNPFESTIPLYVWEKNFREQDIALVAEAGTLL